jgi:hypothetical protein
MCSQRKQAPQAARFQALCRYKSAHQTLLCLGYCFDSGQSLMFLMKQTREGDQAAKGAWDTERVAGEYNPKQKAAINKVHPPEMLCIAAGQKISGTGSGVLASPSEVYKPPQQ